MWSLRCKRYPAWKIQLVNLLDSVVSFVRDEFILFCFLLGVFKILHELGLLVATVKGFTVFHLLILLGLSPLYSLPLPSVLLPSVLLTSVLFKSRPLNSWSVSSTFYFRLIGVLISLPSVPIIVIAVVFGSGFFVTVLLLLGFRFRLSFWLSFFIFLRLSRGLSLRLLSILLFRLSPILVFGCAGSHWVDKSNIKNPSNQI